MPVRGMLRAPIVLIVLCAASAGCSERQPFPELYPLTGTVTIDGKPAAGGGIIFVLDSGARSPLVVNAAVRPDGTFAAQTEYTGDRGTVTRPGVPAGTYKAIYHPSSDGSKTDLDREVEQRVSVEAKATAVGLVVPLSRPGDAPKPEK